MTKSVQEIVEEREAKRAQEAVDTLKSGKIYVRDLTYGEIQYFFFKKGEYDWVEDRFVWLYELFDENHEFVGYQERRLTEEEFRKRIVEFWPLPANLPNALVDWTDALKEEIDSKRAQVRRIIV